MYGSIDDRKPGTSHRYHASTYTSNLAGAVCITLVHYLELTTTGLAAVKQRSSER